MTPDPGRVVRFDDFELDRHTLELRRGGMPVKLQAQPARVLAVLIEHAGDLVSREDLRKQIWDDDTFVDFDRGLNYCINQIRNALGDTAEAPRYLETLRGRGYRFIGRIGRPDAETVSKRGIAWVAAAVVVVVIGVAGVWYAGTQQRSAARAIGVAALVAPQNERQWADALHAQIVSRLTMTSRTPVIDLAQKRASSANPLWRVEGRVDRSSAQYRVTLLLRDTRDGSVRWSDVFAGPPGDWVDAQSEMADLMTAAIRYSIEGSSVGPLKRRAMLPPRNPMPRPSR